MHSLLPPSNRESGTCDRAASLRVPAVAPESSFYYPKRKQRAVSVWRWRPHSVPSRSILVESEIPSPTLIKIGGNGGGASWPRGPSSFADQKRKDKRVVGFRDRQRAFIGVPGRSGSSREEDGGHVRAGLDELRAQAGVVVPESEDPSAVVASGSIQTQATIAGVRRSALKRYGKEGADDDDWDRGFAAKRARE